MHSIRVHCCALAEDFDKALLPFHTSLQHICFRAVHCALRFFFGETFERQDAIMPDTMINLVVLLFVWPGLEIISWGVPSALIHVLKVALDSFQ